MTDWATDFGIRHLAIIPDGNRRWAEKSGLTQQEGHDKGLNQVLPKLIDGLSRDNLHTITVWGFSTENWKRPPDEIDYLMRLFKNFLEEIVPLAHEHQSRIVHLGRCDRFPLYLQETLAAVQRVTETYTQHVYNVALDYGGLDEIERAAERARNIGGSVYDHLDTTGQNHEQIDLLIRFSERRLSGFMPLQAAYAEIVFADAYFPDVTMAMLEEIGREYTHRLRRFGA